MSDASVVEAMIARHVPGVEFRVELSEKVVAVFTDQPGRVIGRRGVVADAIRSELEEHFGRPMRLTVIEDRRDGGTGVREPRPRPDPPPDREAAFLDALADEFERWDLPDVVDSLDDRSAEA